MSPLRRHLPSLVAAGAGIALWLGTSFVSGRREPWDGPEYWSVAYPLALLTALALGWLFPVRPWRWAVVLFCAQFVAMLMRNGELGGLWPLGLILFLGLSLPAVVLAQLAARWRRRLASAE